jgi:hypothetical protein
MTFTREQLTTLNDHTLDERARSTKNGDSVPEPKKTKKSGVKPDAISKAPTAIPV